MPLCVKLYLLLIVINGAPPILSLLLPDHGKRALDMGRPFADGRPVLGDHKTVRGFFGAVLAGTAAGYLMDLAVPIALWAGIAAMTGDCLSSFIKRRLALEEGKSLHGIDQLFEGGLPVLLFHRHLPVETGSAALLMIAFLLTGIFVSVMGTTPLFASPFDRPRLIRSATRFRQWRACHTALSPFVRLLNFENVLYYRWIMKTVFKALGLYRQGIENALDIRVKPITLTLPGLPKSFHAYRILFISDLHIDGLEGITDRLIGLVGKTPVDLCLLGGDYRMEMYGKFYRASRNLRRLTRAIRSEDGIFGILGNHDCLEVTPDLEDAGIYMLVNDSHTLEKNGEKLAIAGVDDPHYYRCHDLEQAFSEVPEEVFTILLAHSPEIVLDLSGQRIDLCLCGHTHGGQICLPVIGPIFTHSRAPRRLASGLWRYRSITGYTTSGAGASGIPLRFNCPPEVVLLTLKGS